LKSERILMHGTEDSIKAGAEEGSTKAGDKEDSIVAGDNEVSLLIKAGGMEGLIDLEEEDGDISKSLSQASRLV
jgi:hypothetical protein